MLAKTVMSAIATILSALAKILTPLMAFIAGKNSERGRQKAALLEVKKKQLEVSIQAAKTRKEIIDRLRKKGL